MKRTFAHSTPAAAEVSPPGLVAPADAEYVGRGHYSPEKAGQTSIGQPAGALAEPARDGGSISADALGWQAAWMRNVAAYIALTKPRVISLLLLTALGGVALGSDGTPTLQVVLLTLLGGALSAGGANAINCYIDRDIDGLMGRTTQRPIPAGMIPPAGALGFGIALGAGSLLVFGLFLNPLSAALSLLALLFYVFVYTRWLKRSTPSNIVIGGAAGALPPVIGWAAATGEVSLLAIWLFVIVFYWTPPHFWALSLLIKRQYEKAGVPMLPIVRGDHETRRQILWYSVLLVALTALLVPFELMGMIYLAAALLLGGYFVYFAQRLLLEATSSAARRLYKYSLLYLALLFVAMVIDRRVYL